MFLHTLFRQSVTLTWGINENGNITVIQAVPVFSSVSLMLEKSHISKNTCTLGLVRQKRLAVL